VGSLHEGFPYAVEISNRGYHAFVLKYRVGRGGSIATEDLAAALSYIFQNAGSLGVTTADYSLWGSSAGARMAAAIGSHGSARYGGSDLPKPSALVLLYTGHSDLSSTEPPTFVAVGDRDRIAAPATMEKRVAALRRLGTEVEYRKYSGVGHGFGLGVGTSAEGWIADAVRFWAKQIQRRPNADQAMAPIDQVYTARKVDTAALSAAGPRLSAAASDAARARGVHDEFGAVAPKFVELTNDMVFDDVWRRSDLSPRDRSLVTIAALAATGDDELEMYLRRGLESGLTAAQIGEAVTHVAFYAGWSKATRAMRAVTRVLGK
jgi:alkylhydroperoxidase/carboxymuconolactone decarboxylase family protein YurZ